MDKEIVVHMYSGMLAIKRNVFESVLMQWINLEPLMQSEVIQKEKLMKQSHSPLQQKELNI